MPYSGYQPTSLLPQLILSQYLKGHRQGSQNVCNCQSLSQIVSALPDKHRRVVYKQGTQKKLNKRTCYCHKVGGYWCQPTT